MKRDQLFFSASYHFKLSLIATLMVKLIHAFDVIFPAKLTLANLLLDCRK